MNPLVAVTVLGDAALWIWVALNLRAWGKLDGALLAGLVVDIYVNYTLKMTFRAPRPAEVGGVVSGVGYGFPSGHVETVTLATTYLALRDRKLSPLTILIPVVAYTRLALGVHYPVDVLGGFAVGAAMALAVRLAEGRVPGGKVAGVLGMALGLATPFFYSVRRMLLSGFLVGSSLAVVFVKPHSDGLGARGMALYNLGMAAFAGLYVLLPADPLKAVSGALLGVWGLASPSLIKKYL